MDSIPLQLQVEFETLLRNKAIPTGLHPLYKKWLRFYLDFCRKYRFSEKERKSLEHFLLKLQEKKQTEIQQQQASKLFTKRTAASKAFLKAPAKAPAFLDPRRPRACR